MTDLSSAAGSGPAPAAHPGGPRRSPTIQAAQRRWAAAVGAELGEAELKETSAFLDRVLRAVRTLPGRRRPEGQEGEVLA
jgi:hypothetical protein